MRFNGTTVPTHRDDTYDTSEVSRYHVSSGGDIEVEALNVTENGAYTAPDGKAYSPVNVNVEGSGSSDFTTAQVEIISNESDVPLSMASLAPDGDDDGINTYWTTYPDTFIVPLYKGRCLFCIVESLSDASYSSENFTVTGDIEIDGNVIIVTGNGTITFTP